MSRKNRNLLAKRQKRKSFRQTKKELKKLALTLRGNKNSACSQAATKLLNQNNINNKNGTAASRRTVQNNNSAVKENQSISATIACQTYDLPEDSIRSWYERIRTKLSEDDGTKRVYHNWSMLAHKQPELERAKPHIVLASFFQYYAFDLERNCAQENCEMFKEFCRDAMVEDNDMKQIVCHLLGEKSSEAISSDVEDDMAKLQDLDLLILASSPDTYKNYADLSRQEWLNAGKTNYEDLRRKTLNALLALDIYQTSDFNTKYAKAARSNIEQELKELEEC